MTTEYLRYFLAACDCGSILEASRRLFISSQGLGQGIRKLETSLGMQLLTRTQTGVHPTEFGSEFYSHAKAVCMELDKLDEFVEQYKLRRSNNLIIGIVGNSKFLSGITACAKSYAAEFPDSRQNIAVQTFEDGRGLLDCLRDGTIDIALMFHSRLYPEFRYSHVSDFSPLMLMCSRDNPISRQDAVPITQLEKLQFVCAGENDPFISLINALCLDYGFKPNNVFFSTENNVIASLVDHDAACILLRENYHSAISHFSRNSKLLPLSPELKIANSIVTARNNDNPEMRKFVKYLLNYLNNIVGIHYRPE